MKKILLLCNAGMSTSLLVNKMKKEVEKQNLAITIEAKSLTEGKNELADYDCILLGPQIRYELDKVRSLSEGVPVEAIGMQDYGLLNAAGVLAQAQKMMER